VSVGEIGAQALDASVLVTQPDSVEHKLALLTEAEGQLAVAEASVVGTNSKREKYQRLAEYAQSDYDHAVSERDRLAALVETRRAALED